MKTLALSEQTHTELALLKMESGARSSDELIEKLILEHKKRRLLESSALFRKKMEDKKLGIKDVLKESKKIRDELYDEWFENSR